ncbi:MAG: class IV adenylate cyclase [Candidatus Hodarchaeales archaeon]|jgi:adenylate cyclase class 2
MLEIEIKIKINKISEERLKKFVNNSDIRGRKTREKDFYLDRDFEMSSTDKALRIRLSETEGKKWIELTYKGPKLSDQVKSRKEINIKLDECQLDNVLTFFEQLGFNPVGKVSKKRVTWDLVLDGWKYHVSLDKVDDLGTYLEIETTTTMEKKGEGEKRVSSMLCQLIGEDEVSKSKSILKSYLELILAKQVFYRTFDTCG